MHRLHRTRSAYRSLIVVALGTLVLTGCYQGTSTPSSLEIDAVPQGGIEVLPGVGATAVVGDDLPATIQAPNYYLYILDRDGVPVQRFECEGNYATNNDTGWYCQHPDGTYTIVSEAVPALMTTEQLPLKDEQPAPEQ